MGSFANSLFKMMLGWLQAAVSAVWSAFTSENGSSVFNWIGRHWILLAGILCVIGLVTDLCVYIFRWKPYKVWKSFFTGSRNTDFRQPNANPKPTGSQKEKTGDIGQINRPAAEPAVRIRQDIPAESDFSRWETSDAEDTNDEIVQPEEKPATITNAGYIVPADSPYRRPAEEGIRTVETEQAPIICSPVSAILKTEKEKNRRRSHPEDVKGSTSASCLLIQKKNCVSLMHLSM